MFGAGAVCDVGVLSPGGFRLASQLGGDLFIPSATYSWLARDRLIRVRQHIVKYTFVSQLVRDGRIFAVYLPEILDELARRLLFLGEREVPLTDLRAILLAAHLGFPVACIGDELPREIAEELGGRTLLTECLDGENHPLTRATRAYRSARAGRIAGGAGGHADGRVILRLFHIDLSAVIDEYVEERVLPPESMLKLDDCSLVSTISLSDDRTESS